MNAARFAGLRRRILKDALFRASLRAAFEHTLTQAGVYEALTEAQRHDLRLTLLLHDALHLADRRRTGMSRSKPVSALRPLPPSPTVPRRPPMDIGVWRARRAR